MRIHLKFELFGDTLPERKVFPFPPNQQHWIETPEIKSNLKTIAMEERKHLSVPMRHYCSYSGIESGVFGGFLNTCCFIFETHGLRPEYRVILLLLEAPVIAKESLQVPKSFNGRGGGLAYPFCIRKDTILAEFDSEGRDDPTKKGFTNNLSCTMQRSELFHAFFFRRLKRLPLSVMCRSSLVFLLPLLAAGLPQLDQHGRVNMQNIAFFGSAL